MTFLFHRQHTAITFILIFFPTIICSAANPTNEFPTLSMHGEHYANACAPLQRKELKDTLLTNNVRDAAQAWRAIDAFLCAPNNDINRIYLESIIPKKIRQTTESTGDEATFKLVTRSRKLVQDLIAGGKAWDANIQTEPDKITLQYFANEVCVKERALIYKDFRWSLYEVGEACD